MLPCSQQMLSKLSLLKASWYKYIVQHAQHLICIDSVLGSVHPHGGCQHSMLDHRTTDSHWLTQASESPNFCYNASCTSPYASALWLAMQHAEHHKTNYKCLLMSVLCGVAPPSKTSNASAASSMTAESTAEIQAFREANSWLCKTTQHRSTAILHAAIAQPKHACSPYSQQQNPIACWMVQP